MSPESTKIPCIHSPVCEACVVLQDVDEEILRMTYALQKLDKRRQEVVATLNRSHDRVTRLPPEISSHIFYLYADSETSSVLNGLFTIALVARSWRDIVLSAPQLWTSITLSVHDRKWTLPHAIAETWLKRSGGLHVDVTLRWINDPMEPRYLNRLRRVKLDQKFFDILDLLQQYSGRMRHLELQVPMDILPRLDFTPNPTQQFSLYLQNDVLRGTGSLQIPSELKQITHLRLDATITPQNALDIFRQCPLLVEWTSLVVRNANTLLFDPVANVQPEHLSNFEVEFEDDVNPLFVNALTMPRLQRFAVKLSAKTQITLNGLTNIPRISSVLSRSPNLSDFSFQCAGIIGGYEISEFVANFYTLPQLQSLSLTFDADHDTGWGPLPGWGDWHPTIPAFQPFLEPKPGPPFLPNLRRFYYSTPLLQPWSLLAAFYKYHSTDATVRSLLVADFSGCAELLPRGIIDKEPLDVFLTLPTTGLALKLNLKLLATSIEHHGLLAPRQDVLSYYTGLEKCLSSVRKFRKRVMWHLNPDTSLNDTLMSDAEMDEEEVSESAKVTFHVYGH